MNRTVCLALVFLGLSACQHGQSAVPAVLADASPETMDAVKSALASALDRGRIELGAGDPTTSSTIIVVPPRLTEFETRSPASPIRFDLWIRDDACFALRDGSTDEIALPGVACRPL